MNAKAVLLMFLISLISYTGFSHTDLRQNSVVDDIVCISADNITTSDVASVDFSLQNSYVHSVTKSDTIMIIIDTKQFNQVTETNYSIIDVGKEINAYLFKPLTTIIAVNLYDRKSFNDKITPKRCHCWLAKLTRNPRDGLFYSLEV